MSVCISGASSLNQMEQEDVAMEAVTQVTEYIDKVSDFDECRKLVVSISKNRLLDLVRKRARQKHGAGKIDSLDQIEGFDPIDRSDAQPDELTALADETVLLGKLLKIIPEKYGNPVADYYFDGLSHREIAEKRGLKIGSIGVYIDRGLKALFKIFPKNAP